MFSRLTKISLKFIVILVPTVTLCTLLFLGVFVYLKYSQLNNALQSKVELIANMHALAIAEPLWMLNYESMYRNLGTISVHPEIICVEVIDTYENKKHGWSQIDCSEYNQQYILQIDLVFNQETVGKLTLYYTKDSIISAMLREIEIGALLFFLLVIATVITALVALRAIIGVPLKQLLESIRIADKEKTLVPANWSSRDELGQAIAAYNAMIKQANQREAELKNARLQAEEASRTKSAFLANMSHELRNPLNAIIGFSRIVMRRSQQELAPKQFDNMAKILTSAEHLLSLINNILDLSKIEAGRMEINRHAFDLELLLDTCLHTMEPMIKGKGLNLSTHIEPELPVLFNDEEKLKQILLNLLSNAAKFTKQGNVTVSAYRQDDHIIIEVTDTGIGIATEQQESIFSEFTQLDSGSTKEYGGTGLGLSICRHLTQLLGGSIAVASQLGSGSTFTLTIPVYNAPLEKQPTNAYEENINR